MKSHLVSLLSYTIHYLSVFILNWDLQWEEDNERKGAVWCHMRMAYRVHRLATGCHYWLDLEFYNSSLHELKKNKIKFIFKLYLYICKQRKADFANRRPQEHVARKVCKFQTFLFANSEAQMGLMVTFFMHLITSKTELRSFISPWRIWTTSESSELI